MTPEMENSQVQSNISGEKHMLTLYQQHNDWSAITNLPDFHENVLKFSTQLVGKDRCFDDLADNPIAANNRNKGAQANIRQANL